MLLRSALAALLLGSGLLACVATPPPAETDDSEETSDTGSGDTGGSTGSGSGSGSNTSGGGSTGTGTGTSGGNTSTGTGTGTGSGGGGTSTTNCISSGDCADGEKCQDQVCVKDSGVQQAGNKSFLQKGADCSCNPDSCDPGLARGGTSEVSLACVDDNVLNRSVCVVICDDISCPDGEQCESLGSFSACFPPPENPKEIPGCAKDSDCKSGYVCTDYFGKQCRKACEPVKRGDEECASNDDCKAPMTCKQFGDNKFCEDPNPCDEIGGAYCYEVPGAGGGNVTACMVIAKKGEACGNGNGKGGGNTTHLCDPDNKSIQCTLETDWSGVCRSTCTSASDCPTGWKCQEVTNSPSACVPDLDSETPCSRD